MSEVRKAQIRQLDYLSLVNPEAQSTIEKLVLGVVLYDGDCGFCSRWTQYWKRTLARHGFEIASLDERWVAEKIRMPREELLTDIRLLTADGRLISGADVYIYVARQIWWAWPVYAIFSFPGLNWLIQVGYRWFARNRYFISRSCRLHPR